MLGQFEGKGTGVTFDNWTQGISIDDNFTFISVIVFLFLDSFLYIGITFYLDQVHPGQHGIAQPWYFPIQSCLPRRFSKVETDLQMKAMKKSATATSNGNVANGHAGHPKVDVTDQVFIEDEAVYANRSIGIKIVNLVKMFKQFGRVKAAVKNLSLNIYENQITVLLGNIYF